ncbi:MAG: ribosome silencing factor [Clostridia bacterium]|nr:ribosome silencing factor [Clostridia bacterium]
MEENKNIIDVTEEENEEYTISSSLEDPVQHEQAGEVAKKIAMILDSKKAMDIKLINVHKKTVLADFFVFATGTSTTQVNSLADEVEFKLKTEDGIEPLRVEGAGSGSWVLVDYGSVIVHVLGVQSKEFYKLEKLWADGVEVPFDRLPEDK